MKKDDELLFRRIVNTLVRNGHREKDIIWDYSIEKVSRYYADLIELEMLDRRKLSIDVYMATSVAHLTESREANRKRLQAWEEHLKNLDPKHVKKEAETKKKDPFAKLRLTGLVPFVKE